MIPSTHVRNVKAGKVGSSVIGTVSRTSSIGESLIVSAEQEKKKKNQNLSFFKRKIMLIYFF